jgi:hypothetical protein
LEFLSIFSSLRSPSVLVGRDSRGFSGRFCCADRKIKNQPMESILPVEGKFFMDDLLIDVESLASLSLAIVGSPETIDAAESGHERRLRRRHRRACIKLSASVANVINLSLRIALAVDRDSSAGRSFLARLRSRHSNAVKRRDEMATTLDKLSRQILALEENTRQRVAVSRAAAKKNGRKGRKRKGRRHGN